MKASHPHVEQHIRVSLSSATALRALLLHFGQLFGTSNDRVAGGGSVTTRRKLAT